MIEKSIKISTEPTKLAAARKTPPSPVPEEDSYRPFGTLNKFFSRKLIGKSKKLRFVVKLCPVASKKCPRSPPAVISCRMDKIKWTKMIRNESLKNMEVSKITLQKFLKTDILPDQVVVPFVVRAERDIGSEA